MYVSDMFITRQHYVFSSDQDYPTSRVKCKRMEEDRMHRRSEMTSRGTQKLTEACIRAFKEIEKTRQESNQAPIGNRVA